MSFLTDNPMDIAIINGPNLNLLGKRETDIYGGKSFEDFLSDLQQRFQNCRLQYHQSNVEGEIVDLLQRFGFSGDGIVLNAGAYTHTSIAIHDSIAAIKTPVVEVHISNIYNRESFRHLSLITSKCAGMITGFGMEGYAMAISYFLHRNNHP